MIEAIGVPHSEVDVVFVNGESVDFNYRLRDGDDVAVYPVFESFDISAVTRLRAKPLRETRFIADVHLGKLTSLLRLMGFDTYYRNNLDDPEIIDIAEKQGRIILTRDIGLLKHKRVTRGYWVRRTDHEAQAEEVVRRFQLEDSVRPFTRCARCNGILEEVDKEVVKNDLPPKSGKHYTRFFKCFSCGQIYWRGSHYPKLLKKMERIGIIIETNNEEGDY